MHNFEEILLALNELESDFSQSFDSKKMTFWMKIALFLKEIQHKMNKNWEKIPRKMFLTKAKPTVKEVNDIDFHEGP